MSHRLGGCSGVPAEKDPVFELPRGATSVGDNGGVARAKWMRSLCETALVSRKSGTKSEAKLSVRPSSNVFALNNTLSDFALVNSGACDPAENAFPLINMQLTSVPANPIIQRRIHVSLSTCAHSSSALTCAYAPRPHDSHSIARAIDQVRAISIPQQRRDCVGASLQRNVSSCWNSYSKLGCTIYLHRRFVQHCCTIPVQRRRECASKEDARGRLHFATMRD